jgi:type IV secretory pathway component VirB8
MDMDEWNKLGFDPKRDGKWPTTDDIKNRIRQLEKEKRKTAVTIVGLAVLGLAILGFTIYFLL